VTSRSPFQAILLRIYGRSIRVLLRNIYWLQALVEDNALGKHRDDIKNMLILKYTENRTY